MKTRQRAAVRYQLAVTAAERHAETHLRVVGRVRSWRYGHTRAEQAASGRYQRDPEYDPFHVGSPSAIGWCPVTANIAGHAGPVNNLWRR